MAKCVLHVGMPKSGTTSIQYSLRSLADDKFYYARILNRPSHSIPVTAMFAPAGDRRLDSSRFARDGMDIRETVPEAIADLESSIRIADGRTVILSGEAMLHMHRGDLERLKAFFAERGHDDIEVIAYIRPPLGYVSSAVQQKLKSQPKMGFDIGRLLPNYNKRFARFDEVFGPEKVRLIKFDPKSFPDRDVVSDICQQLGIPLASIAPVKKNEGITRLAAQLRYRLAVLGEARGLEPLSRRLGVSMCQRLRPLDETRFRLAPSYIRPHIDSIEDDIAWMEQRLGQPLRDDLTDEPNDVHGPDDFLKPIPGIEERLRALLAEDGVAIPAEHAEDELQLLTLVGEASGTWAALAEAEGEEDESADDGKRAARRQARAERRHAASDSGREQGRRDRPNRRSEEERAERRARREQRRKDDAVPAAD